MRDHGDGNKNTIGLSHIVITSPPSYQGRAVANRPKPSTTPAESAHDHIFATLVHQHRRARPAQSCAELDFIAVKETHELAPYRQAALWLEGEGVSTLSGVATPEANAPYVQWLNRLLRRLARQNSPHPCPV